MKKSSILFLMIFVFFLPIWLFLSLQEYFDPVLMLIIYVAIVVPLFIKMKKYEKAEEKVEDLK